MYVIVLYAKHEGIMSVVSLISGLLYSYFGNLGSPALISGGIQLLAAALFACVYIHKKLRNDKVYVVTMWGKMDTSDGQLVDCFTVDLVLRADEWIKQKVVILT